jgi:PilZ domain
MSQTAIITQEQMPLGVGSLVSLSVNICEPLPAIVAGGDELSLVLQTAGRHPAKVGDRAVIGWSIGGELHELRSRVMRPYGIESELTVSRHGIITRTGDRRGVARFVLVAGGSLLVEEDHEVLGFTHDLSIHGVGLLLEGEAPPLGTRGELEVRDALGVLLPRASVRIVHTSETSQPGVARVGLAFDDPERVAGATERLLAVLA